MTGMREKVGAAVVLMLCCGVFAGGLAMWVDAPPRRVPFSPAVATPEAAPDGETERALCGLVDRPQGLDLRIVDQASRSGKVHYTLAAVLQQYAAEPTPGAREQVLIECRRLDLLP